ncbi:protein FAR1-RELATED SEQUENCE 5-like [Phragmites australis]|uniref:protein FAR1-RELATED SEQUENCE 5-like n=1 Tax=Phragmites australis TaxID=29695 RepID=UPI002D76531E|nr:protein FAR1-RELATED SEQUENCE 5-like [Phragmites australis]
MFVGSNHQLQNVIFGKALIHDESADSFGWLFTTFTNCMHGYQPHVLLTDEDPAMKLAVPEVFDKTQHRYCNFHVLRTSQNDLDTLYIAHKGLREKVEGLFNFPLSPTEFEQAWTETMQEYAITEHPAIKSLWEKRKMWIETYFKGLYCGRMTSTQRSESTNRVLKDEFVNKTTSLHMFTKKMLEAIQHVDHMEAWETHYS